MKGARQRGVGRDEAAMTNLSRPTTIKTTRKNITTQYVQHPSPLLKVDLPRRDPARNNTLCLTENRVQSRHSCLKPTVLIRHVPGQKILDFINSGHPRGNKQYNIINEMRFKMVTCRELYIILFVFLLVEVHIVLYVIVIYNRKCTFTLTCDMYYLLTKVSKTHI